MISTSWTAVSFPDTTFSGGLASETTWSGGIPEALFPIPACEIVGPPDGPYLAACEMVAGNSAAQGALAACEMGQDATYWFADAFGETEWGDNTVTGTTTWTTELDLGA